MTFVIDIADRITGVNTLQERLVYARKLRGLSQIELAKMVPCAQTTIAQVERGRTKTLRDLTTFARVLRVSPDWLAEGKGPPPSEKGQPAAPPPSVTRIGAGRRSADLMLWPFTLSREDFDRYVTAEQFDAIDKMISSLAPHQPQRPKRNSA